MGASGAHLNDVLPALTTAVFAALDESPSNCQAVTQRTAGQRSERYGCLQVFLSAGLSLVCACLSLSGND